MELLLVALSGFFWWEVIKLFFPWPMPGFTQPVTISAIAYAMWACFTYLPSDGFIYVFAAAGGVSILAYLFGNPSTGWAVKPTVVKRTAPGSWPPGTRPGRNKPSMPRL